MPTGTWPLSWATGDLMQAAEFKKGIGAISDTTLGGSAANVDITGIVATYAHLLVVAYARSDTAAPSTTLALRFNNDTAANYDYQQLRDDPLTQTAVAAEAFAQTSMLHGLIPANTATANLFGVGIVFIPHYAGSTNNKVALSISSAKTANVAGSITNTLRGGFWRSNATVNRITLLPTAGNFVAGTRVSIYGMGA